MMLGSSVYCGVLWNIRFGFSYSDGISEGDLGIFRFTLLRKSDVTRMYDLYKEFFNI